MSRPTIDHRGPEFQTLSRRLLEDLKWVFRTEHPVFTYPASGSGGWEAAIVNTLSPGDRVLVFNQGFFAQSWAKVAERFGVRVHMEPCEARRGLAADMVVDALRADEAHEIKAVLVVHNETSTGVTSNLQVIGRAVRESGHPALLFVDAVSSLAVTDLRHDEWGLDVTVSGSQKGLMLPPGLSFTAVSPRALTARETAALSRSYWSWDDHLALNPDGYFPYTPATNLLYGLRESIDMLREEGLEHVFRRHDHFAEATRTAVAAWDLETFAADPREASGGLTAVLLPDGYDADDVRAVILERFDMSLGTGLGDVTGRVFRIGHMGDLNVLALMGTLAGVEMGLKLSGVPYRPGGVAAAMDYLTSKGGVAG